MEYLGILLSILLLIGLALKGVNIIFSSILCSLVVVITSDMSVADAFARNYAFGPLGAFTFAGKFLLLFVSGAVFGRMMGESHAASSIALALTRCFGAQRALLITTVAAALLTYGGLSCLWLFLRCIHWV